MVTVKNLAVDAGLEKLQGETFDCFLHETNPANGLVIDKTAAGWPASIAASSRHVWLDFPGSRG